MMLEDGCVSDCPPGYLSNYDADTCRSLSDLDAKTLPFPFIIITLLCLALSWVGSKQKKKHLLVVNFIVMMGVVEHIALITQIVLTFAFGTWKWAVPIILFWVAYVLCNILFQIRWYQEVVGKDKYYKMWRDRPENRGSRRLMNALGWILSWKEYKLTYSGFWG